MAILVTDADARIVAANSFACELLGYSLAELLELRVIEVSPDERAAEEMYAELVGAGEQRGLAPVRRRDGSVILLRYFAKSAGDGVHFVSFAVPRRVVSGGTSTRAEASGRSRDRAALSTREFEILALLAEGLENDEIARSLHVAPDTVKAHVSRVLSKLGARSRTHAVSVALRSGVLD